jgi:hypothetical protein
MKRLSLSLLLLTALLVSVPARADVLDSNGNLWLNYVGDHPLFGSKWGLHLEAQTRRADFGENWQQLLLRPGINYTLNPNTVLSAGYAWVHTWPYGDFPAKHEFSENRLWEQVAYTRPWLGLEWTHRFRLEQRRIAEMLEDADGEWNVGNWRYENRLRYMLRTSIPLTESKRTYLALWNEVFINFGSNVSGNVFDQNRAFIGIGRKLTDTTRVEVGFMEQTIQRRGGQIWENNHTISVWLMSKWPFGK